MRISDRLGNFTKACERLRIDRSRFRCPICGSSSQLCATGLPKQMNAMYSASFFCTDCDWSDYEPHLIEEGVHWKDMVCEKCGRELASLEMDTSSPESCRSYVRAGVEAHSLPGEVGYVVCPADGSRTTLAKFE